MKRLLIVFGILDILTLVRSFTIKTNLAGIWTEGQMQLITICNWTLLASLGFSAYFLIRQNIIGIWLTYVQFPIRIMFMVLSFDFVVTVTDLLDIGYGIYSGLIWVILSLEIVRLINTIQIHRKNYCKARTSPI
jgi:hypothetical protein